MPKMVAVAVSSRSPDGDGDRAGAGVVADANRPQKGPRRKHRQAQGGAGDAEPVG